MNEQIIESTVTKLIEDGNTHAKQREYEAAIQCYRQALTRAISSVEAGRGLAQVLKDKYQYNEATTVLEEALGVAEGEQAAEVCVDLANVRAAACYYEDALKWCERALTMLPDHAPAHNQKGLVLYFMNRYEEAERVVDEALRLSLGKIEFRVTKGRILVVQHRFEDALTWLDETVKIAPTSALSWEWLGHTYRVARQRDEALKAYQKAIECDKWFLAAYADVGELYGNEGQHCQ